ncbi:MAG: DUF3180 family protein [Schumannella sp.]|nr:DUF3180 family protein [Microbacteriaceae bacterium]
MTRTRPGTLVLLAAIGAVAAFALQGLLAAVGLPKFRPEYTLAVTLVLVGVAALLLALPVRRAVRGAPAHRVDPFYATRVVVLAKASALAGALLGGAGAGLLAELLVRAGAPGADAYLRAGSVLAGGAVLLAAGLIAEHWCTVPKDSDDDPAAASDSGSPPGPGAEAAAG